MHGELKTPPMGRKARMEAGFYLRIMQNGELLSMPISRPMSTIGANCHELRIDDLDNEVEWRIIYFIDSIAIVVLEVFKKKTRDTPENVKKVCRDRLDRYLKAKEGQ